MARTVPMRRRSQRPKAEEFFNLKHLEELLFAAVDFISVIQVLKLLLVLV